MSEKTVVPDEVYDFINEMTDGISDEMTMSQITKANKAYTILQSIRKADKPCEHDWTDWSYAVSPSGRRACKKCGKVEFD